MHILYKGFRKKRCKSCCCELLSKIIKICKRCFLCQSIVFCQTCNQFPCCCLRFTCRGKTTKHLESLVRSGCWSKSSSNQASLGFFIQLFMVPKPNNRWRPILGLRKLNQFLKVEKFKMETPETIRTSLQQGE